LILAPKMARQINQVIPGVLLLYQWIPIHKKMKMITVVKNAARVAKATNIKLNN